MVLTLNELKQLLRSGDRPSQRDWEDIADTLYDAARRALSLNVADGSLTPAAFADGPVSRYLGTDESGNPGWYTLPEGEAATPIGPAGGDLSGDYPDPIIRNERVTLSKLKKSEGQAGGVGSVLRWNGTDFEYGIPSFPYVVIKDVKNAGVDGGAFTAGGWRERTLNSHVATLSGISSLSSNLITLQPGTWQCRISCPAFSVNYHQARLYNVTDGTTALIGTAGYNHFAEGESTVHSFIIGILTIAGAKTFRVEHRCLSGHSHGFGVGSPTTFWPESDGGITNKNVFTVAEFWKIG